MKRDLGIMDKRVFVQNQVQAEKPERKAEISSCLQLMGGAGQGGGVAYYQHKLADWFLANYFQLKANAHMFLQYGNLKFLNKQNREYIAMLFKKCEEKLGDCMTENDMYSTLLMKNPYMGYQPLAFMYPPYGMPSMPGMPSGYSGIGGNMENYQKMYNMDMQQYYMQMSKYGYSVNTMYMPPMSMGMPKYDPSQNPNAPSKGYYNPYAMMQQPPMVQQMKPKTITPPPIPTSRLRSGEQPPKPNKQINIQQQEQIFSDPQKRNKQKPRKQLPKNAPFIIIPPHMQKIIREQIPQKLFPLTQNPTQNIELINNNDSSQIQIVQKPVQITNQNCKRQINTTLTPQNKNKNLDNNSKNPNVRLSNVPSQNQSYAIAMNNKKLQDQRMKKLQKDAKFNLSAYLGPQFKEQLRQCACNGYGIQPQIFTCTDCSKKYHYYCVQKKYNPKNQQVNYQQCHFCFIKNIDPLNKVIVQIKTSYVMDIKRQKFSEIIDFQLYDSYINKISPFQIQVRCLRLQDASNQVPEYTWPDQCLVTLNQERTIQFQALQHNSSLKKRKDMSIFLTNYIYFYNKNSAARKHLPVGLEIKENTVLEVSQKKIRNNYIFIFGIYLVQKKTPDELCEQILNDPTNKVNFAQKFFSESMGQNGQDDIQIQQIKVTLIDPFTWNLIDVPARGRKCIHGQCFDLKTFLSFMNVQKVRQWKCPVCNKQCRNFCVDTQQIQVIKQFKKHQHQASDKKLSKQIQFHRDGTTLFVVQKQEQQGDHQKNNESQLKKTKQITKAASRGADNSSKSQKEHEVEEVL